MTSRRPAREPEPRGASVTDAAAALTGFLLTRGWRDTPRGIELGFWATSERGPVRLVVEGQEAVCFVERERDLTLPDGARRVERPLARLGGGAVDALYFRRQADLDALRGGPSVLHESDIRPTDRYLMERFVRAGFVATGAPTLESGALTLRNPVLRPADVVPRLRTVSLDIETRGHTDTLYSIAGALARHDGDDAPTVPPTDAPSADPPEAVVFVVGAGEPERRDGYTLRYGRDERAVIEGFFDWLRRVDPDVLSGWSVVGFDLAFLDRKCRALGIPFALGRGGGAARVLGRTDDGVPARAIVPGRAVLDGIELIKATFRVFESYSLEHVSRELLGTGKVIGPESDKVAEIDRLFRDDKPRLADYNVRDCTLVNDILARAQLVEFAARRASLTGLPLERLAGAAPAFDNLYLPRLHRAGFVAPDVRARADASGGPGGHVLDSVPGLHTDVLVLDFKSLYPSLIRTFLIDPLGMALGADDPAAVPGHGGARFAREGHILPGMIETLWAARDAAKADHDAPLSQAIKIIMNSFYGIFATSRCRFYSEALVASITRRGHEILEETRERVEAAGHRVIYGDTDSLFVRLGDADVAPGATSKATSKAMPGGTNGADAAAGRALVDALNAHWRDALRERFGLESALELEYETHYERFFMPSLRGSDEGGKKRYAGLVRHADGASRLVIKGLEAVRTDSTPLARDFQRELLRRVFTDGPVEDWVRETVARLRAGELDDSLAYRRRLRRPVVEYGHGHRAPAHVQAARQLASPGRWIRYVMTRDGPQPVEALTSMPDHEHYVERQLGPAGDGVLRALGTSVAELTDAQLSMF